ncbi:hypothetical protein PoB_004954700 [Plakobranchus ocellatus]|uniref:Uncharacterized protein n=1 Tax=Plakobranchus ocellatus TaxID=259542 RepID=A0AAV4BVG3_9GAST|nr:hypothetical protein PoB_004954700 [Plakobranchus ocellatus]
MLHEESEMSTIDPASLQWEVNKRHWASQYCAQKMFRMESVRKTTPNNNISGKKSALFQNTLKDQDGKTVEVYKGFFLGIPGYEPKKWPSHYRFIQTNAIEQAFI